MVEITEGLNQHLSEDLTINVLARVDDPLVEKVFGGEAFAAILRPDWSDLSVGVVTLLESETQILIGHENSVCGGVVCEPLSSLTL
jgi:hypothetical protein